MVVRKGVQYGVTAKEFHWPPPARGFIISDKSNVRPAANGRKIARQPFAPRLVFRDRVHERPVSPRRVAIGPRSAATGTREASVSLTGCVIHATFSAFPATPFWLITPQR